MALGLAAATLGSGLVSAAGSLIGSGVSSASGIAATKLQHKYNKEMWEKQSQFSREEAERAHERQVGLYSRSFKDTTFKAQIEQMKQAGLNPAMMYASGQGGTAGHGTASTGAQAQTPSTLPLDTSGISSAGTTLGMIASGLGERVAEVNLKTALAKKANAEAGVTEEVGSSKAFAEIDAIRASTEGTRLNNAMTVVETRIKSETADAEIGRLISEAQAAAAEAKVQTSTADERVELVTQNLIGSYIENMLRTSQVKLTEAQTEEVLTGVSQMAEKLILLEKQVRSGEISASAAAKQAEAAAAQAITAEAARLDKSGRTLGSRLRQMVEGLIREAEDLGAETGKDGKKRTMLQRMREKDPNYGKPIWEKRK